MHEISTFLMAFDFLSSATFFTCQHERAHTFHPALHGGFHQSSVAVAVSPLEVQPRVVVEQIVGDCYVALKNTGMDWLSSGHNKQSVIVILARMTAHSHIHTAGPYSLSTLAHKIRVQRVQIFIFFILVCVCSSVSALVPNCLCVYISICACMCSTVLRTNLSACVCL